MDVTAQNLLLTGGVGAIGRALIHHFAPLAASLAVIDIDKDGITRLQSEFPEVKFLHADLTDPRDTERAIGILCDEGLTPSILVNNAGKIHSEPLVNLLSRSERCHAIETWLETIAGNLHTAFFTTRVVAERMVANRIKGLVVNVSSVTAAGNVGQSAYSAAKAGIEALTKTWSKELGVFGIRVAALAPGFFDVESTVAALSDAKLRGIRGQVPLNRLGSIEELIEGFEFVIRNDYFNGKTLELDGGVNI